MKTDLNRGSVTSYFSGLGQVFPPRSQSIPIENGDGDYSIGRLRDDRR